MWLASNYSFIIDAIFSHIVYMIFIAPSFSFEMLQKTTGWWFKMQKNLSTGTVFFEQRFPSFLAIHTIDFINLDFSLRFLGSSVTKKWNSTDFKSCQSLRKTISPEQHKGTCSTTCTCRWHTLIVLCVNCNFYLLGF